MLHHVVSSNLDSILEMLTASINMAIALMMETEIISETLDNFC
jgi:hypothetical protein